MNLVNKHNAVCKAAKWLVIVCDCNVSLATGLSNQIRLFFCLIPKQSNRCSVYKSIGTFTIFSSKRDTAVQRSFTIVTFSVFLMWSCLHNALHMTNSASIIVLYWCSQCYFSLHFTYKVNRAEKLKDLFSRQSLKRLDH